MAGSKIIKNAMGEGRKVLTVLESKQILSEASFPINEYRMARTIDEAVSYAQELGYPIVMKLVSSDIIHKTDLGGVVVDVRNNGEVKEQFERMINTVQEKISQVHIEGIMIEQMVKDGIEIIIGSTVDPIFGKVLMFGLGGIFVEVLKDVSFRLIPIKRSDAEEMLTEIKAAKVLDGVRGKPPADKEAIIDLLLKTSDFVAAHDKIAELDLNPVVVLPDKAIAVDARIVLSAPPEKAKKFGKDQ
ncbi:MAG: acetate--CoA ligase family protein [Promethearchaeota archaeon]